MGKAEADRIERALRKAGKENPGIEGVLRSFGKVLVEQARWRAELAFDGGFELSPEKRAMFDSGVPVSGRGELARLGDLWPRAAGRMIPALSEGFPDLRKELFGIESRIASGEFSPDHFLEASFDGSETRAREIAAATGVEPELLLFVLHQAARPVAEKRAEVFWEAIKDLEWNRGYCPVCGSYPETSLVVGKEGRRVLRCGFCSTQYRFYRLACPFCESQEPDDREILFVEGREQERAEVCRRCGRYVTGIDLRAGEDDFPKEILNFSLMYLDVIAQERGFTPMKGTGRKIVDPSL